MSFAAGHEEQEEQRGTAHHLSTPIGQMRKMARQRHLLHRHRELVAVAVAVVVASAVVVAVGQRRQQQ